MNDVESDPLEKRILCGLRAILAVITLLFIAGFIFPSGGITISNELRSRAMNEAVQLVTALRAHKIEYGALPSGDYAQIIATLTGDNPRKVPFFEGRAERFNERGEFIDPWGSPYRIDTSDPNNPRAYSPGKNKKDEPDVPRSDDVCSWR
jgi:hypothetical protein